MISNQEEREVFFKEESEAMSFQSILGHQKWNKDALQVCNMPTFFPDLNLDQIVQQIISLRKGDTAEKFYYYLPQDLDEIRYRQGAILDLLKEDIYACVDSFLRDMKQAERYEGYMKKSFQLLQRDCWCMDAAYFYCRAVEHLAEGLEAASPAHEAFQSLLVWLKERVGEDSFIRLKKEARERMEELQSLHYSLRVCSDKVVIQKAEEAGEWVNTLWRLLRSEKDGSDTMENPYGEVQALSVLERMVLNALEKEFPSYFSNFHRFYETYNGFMDEILLTLGRELNFYIGFLTYKKKMEKEGFLFTCPEVTETEFQVEGCYDLALAWKNSGKGIDVVPNDIKFYEGEKFFVVTGPNQGGKTTFARTLGQVAYFAMLGLMVPARMAKVPLFYQLLTHFASEESVESGSGKLKEELNRLMPWMNGKVKRSLVLINELFTTATTYDAIIMGKRVMAYFMEQGCLGVYVTHVQELAKQEGGGIVSLVAEVNEKDSHLRTYKMRRRPPDGFGYANDIVEKCLMTYEDVKRRFCQC